MQLPDFVIYYQKTRQIEREPIYNLKRDCNLYYYITMCFMLKPKTRFHILYMSPSRQENKTRTSLSSFVNNTAGKICPAIAMCAPWV